MFFKAIINASAIAGLAVAVPFSTNTTSACPTLCVDAINDCGVMYGGCYPICSPELYPTPPPCTPTTPTTTPTITPITPDITITLITPTPDPIMNSNS
ncbi:hypothetical protein RAB80_012371 [Fusarium oxysporum f. sp. vasinfectum]|uniref:Uncharacterized protein n=1 Tax=Fusarium oxysporum f. sp. vasinfectum 25433 TaxID=1089449 RepID=X0MD92_FUSOX|nr:hypothetical protein FOTG_04064 [Fusarium oxysporum f. sp. vasinfectum 25433]KAK2672292.1 hypothetical protein RAB80_012371 [Fusarium oxysporum f. sp. vasinfectum]KAK2693790.1 hypothetical protein QWA68_008303 [Fusarium oxysporum]KAK2928442.1 hypothetical protein FoTM2_011304 [Fusarium oxysporum f. sp. vasinfectum]